jgi:hypothetical protein
MEASAKDEAARAELLHHEANPSGKEDKPEG